MPRSVVVSGVVYMRGMSLIWCSIHVLCAKMFGRFRKSSESESLDSRSLCSGSSGTGLTSITESESGRFYGRWVLLTYSKCSIESKKKFEEMFVYSLEKREVDLVKYYGCRELHEDGSVHYHVLVNVGKQLNWSYIYMRSMFTVDGNDCQSLNFSPPRPKQNINLYVANVVGYIEKESGGDCFGVRPLVGAQKAEDRKRKWEEIGEQSTAGRKMSKLKEFYPDVFYKNFNNLKSAIEHEHQDEDVYEAFELPSYIRPEMFRVPFEIVQWEFDNSSLLIQGGGRVCSLLVTREVARAGWRSILRLVMVCFLSLTRSGISMGIERAILVRFSMICRKVFVIGKVFSDVNRVLLCMRGIVLLSV